MAITIARIIYLALLIPTFARYWYMRFCGADTQKQQQLHISRENT